MREDVPVSVVMTVFNGERFVSEAITSILHQTFRDFEFIVVDNQSTDRTPEIVSSFNDPRIIFIRNEKNLGQTKALNVGIRHSRGQYIARMDADDAAYPERLEVQFEFLEKNPTIGAVGSWCVDINANGKPIRRVKVPTDPVIIKAYLLASGNLTTWCLTHPTMMIRRMVLDDAGLYHEPNGQADGYPQDYELWSRISARYPIGNIGRPLLKYRILSNSESRNFVDRSTRYCFEITIRKIKSSLPDLSDSALAPLANMLEYRPQSSAESGAAVLGLFDRYFDRAMQGTERLESLDWVKIQMKLYYLPQLFITNKRLSVTNFFGIIARHPSFILDARLYRKMAKVLLSNVLNIKSYDFITRRLFSFR